MGNSTSSSGRGHQEDSVDYGHLIPQGIYTGPRDWNQAVVSQLICSRKLAPFYRPLEEYDNTWDDDQILAARKELPDPENGETTTRIEAAAHSNGSRSKRPTMTREPLKPEAAVYRGAVECPICFLYYPPNINHSRCCDQAICTECFVQIKRSEPTATHLVSEPAACPYCVQDNFGVVYTPPPWRAGIGSEGTTSIWSSESPRGSQQSIESSSPYPTHKRRQKSFGADSPEVVTTDQIRPDWEAKLAAVRAAVARRANRRIIMRQVGDRLIPVGVTSGRVHALSPEEAGAELDVRGSRRGRRAQAQNNQNFEQFMGMGGQDIEELMLMEAMRLSLLDHEEHQRKEAEEKRKKDAAQSLGEPTSDAPGPGPSTSESQSPNLATNLSLSNSSTPISSSPSATSHMTRDSLSGARNSLSFSRSRTPPPPRSDRMSVTDDTSSSLRSRASNPPQFSTLAAALSATSTASAFLGNNVGEASSSTSANGNAVPSLGNRNLTGEPIPTILIDFDGTSPLMGPSDHSLRPSPSHQDSFTSSVSTNRSSSYDHLPSSPDSDSLVSHEPLLGSETGFKLTTSEEGRGDFFRQG